MTSREPFTAITSAGRIRLVGIPICPDLLAHDYLGEADTWRGRVVRGFFWLLRWWPIHPAPKES